MRRIFTCLILVCLTCNIFPETPNPDNRMTATSSVSIIPLPHSVETSNTHYSLGSAAIISLPDDAPEWKHAAGALNRRLKATTGSELSIRINANSEIQIVHDAGVDNDEGYSLQVKADGVVIRAKTANGAHYGIQTLLQLMPASIFSNEGAVSFPIKIRGVKITDEPRFSYRGMHLDVCRHFFTVDEVKQYIDLLAMHKYNTFHWHLTEDQGWRIEIKQYPKLTEIGAFRKETVIGHASERPAKYDGKPYGGYYSQEDVKEVVKYAQERFITIIPEIELPGHAQAAVASYPELGCIDEPLEVMTTWGISENVYCPNEETFVFLENVLNEVMDLFPGEFFHIGGDECPKKQWQESEFCQDLIKREGLKDEYELQSWFIRRIEKMLDKRGRRLVGWDEILEGGLAPNATVMSWRGVKGGIEAAEAGHDVIMTPTSHCYFDYYQSAHPDEPLAIGGYLPLERVYNFDPIPEELEEEKHHHVLGGQANLWTEYIPNFKHLEYMAYPRGAAMAEAVWSVKADKNFEAFSNRLVRQFERYDHMGVNAARAFFEIDGKIISHAGNIKVKLNTYDAGAEIRYTTDGSSPTAVSNLYEAPFTVTQSVDVRAAAFIDGKQKGRSWEGAVNLHKGVGQSISLSKPPAEKYGSGGPGIILNGIYGSDRHYNDKEWLGFEGLDFEGVVELGESTQVSQIKCRFFKQNGSWIYLPKKMTVYTSTDGSNYTEAGSTTEISAEDKVAVGIVNLNAEATHVKVVVDRYGVIPEGYLGGTHEAWLFVGELEIY